MTEEAAIAIAAAITLAAGCLSPVPVVITYYGTQADGYLGQKHGAAWNGYDCGLPDVVDAVHFGAAAPYDIPYCTRLVVSYEGRTVEVVVVDRMRDDLIDGLPHLDVWPAAAEALGMKAEGIVHGTVLGWCATD